MRSDIKVRREKTGFCINKQTEKHKKHPEWIGSGFAEDYSQR